MNTQLPCERCGAFLPANSLAMTCEACLARLDAEEQRKRAQVVVRLAWLAVGNAGLTLVASIIPIFGIFAAAPTLALWIRLRANMREPEPTPSLYEALGPNTRLVQLTLRWVPVVVIVATVISALGWWLISKL